MSPAPVTTNNPIAIKNVLSVSPRANSSLSNLKIGEVHQVRVLQKQLENKFVLAFKDARILATGEIPLKVGERLTVRVAGLEPQIVLCVISEENSKARARIAQSVRQWLAQPELLLQVVSKTAEITGLLPAVNLSPGMPKADAARLIKLLEDVIFSSGRKKNHLFVKEFVSKIGFLLESNLRKLAAENSKGAKQTDVGDNLKSLLVKLSEVIAEVLKDADLLDPLTGAKLVRLHSFAQDALKSIETQQVLNAYFQDGDKTFFLQIPLADAGVFSLAYIFITPEGKNKEEKTSFSSCSVAIFLNMDMLGEIIVSASLRERSFSCLIKCSSEDVRNLVDSNLRYLKAALEACGYNVDYIDCFFEEGLERQRRDFLENKFAQSADLVDYFV